MLIETIIEGGALTEQEIRKALAGHGGDPKVKAIISMIEFAIGGAHDESEGPGAALRDEACGAARHLRLLRTRVMEMLPSDRREESDSG